MASRGGATSGPFIQGCPMTSSGKGRISGSTAINERSKSTAARFRKTDRQTDTNTKAGVKRRAKHNATNDRGTLPAERVGGTSKRAVFTIAKNSSILAE